MRIVNVIIYLLLAGCVFFDRFLYREDRGSQEKWSRLVKKYWYLGFLLAVTNTISLGLTFVPEPKEIYVEKAGYGEEEKEIPILLKVENQEEEISLTVSARQLTREELEKRVEEVFAYLEKHMRGENESLSKVYTDLNYGLDAAGTPFDVEFIPEDYALIDETGVVKNEQEHLLSLGFTKQELLQGIPVGVDVVLWYGEESFQRKFSLRIFPRKRSELEEQVAYVKGLLSEEEKKAAYQEGFYIPTTVEDVEINRLDEEGITPLQVLTAGIILVVLLFFREQENERKKKEYRRECLKRSYPWFVNEIVLLLGAGMQVRNILAMLLREYEIRKGAGDYRDVLLEEIGGAVRAMELGMSEEQAYYQLGRRLEIPSYIKLMTMLEQNVKRGGKGLIAFFEQEELLALEERKNLAKRYGEEAGTKLLGPMILLLFIVMLMIVLPAFMGFA